MLTYQTFGTNRGALLSRWTGTARPTLADCGGLPETAWQVSVTNEELSAGAVYCVMSAGGRYGYLTVTDVKRYPAATGPAPANGLAAVAFSYALWKKAGD